MIFRFNGTLRKYHEGHKVDPKLMTNQIPRELVIIEVQQLIVKLRLFEH